MWRNYLTVGLRALAKNRTYAFINIFGLALGLAACLLILLYVRYETRYDEWLPDSARIFQVQATWHEPGQPVTRNQHSPFPVRDSIASGFPEIEAVTVVLPGQMQTVRQGQPVFVDELYVDPAFFDIFRLEFVRGSAKTALPNVNSLVLTESQALQQFGTLDVLGKTVTERITTGTFDYKVTGVIRDLPGNSHLQIETIARYDPASWDNVPAAFKSWGSMNQLHYVKLRPDADVARVNAGLPAWEKKVIPPETLEGRTATRADIMDLKLVNVADVHLGEAQLGALTPGNDRRTVITFAIVALLILLMACINFINLSTARSGQRAREVALRKVLGASRRQLVGQFLGESLLLVGIAMLIALALVELAAPALGAFLDADLRFGYFGAEGFLVPVLLLAALVGALGGLYPALYLSRFQPAAVLKANASSAQAQGSPALRNALVVTQFAISIGLIVCTAVIYSQTRFVETIDPGYEREGLIQMEGAYRLAASYDSFKREALRVPGVAAVGLTNLGVAATNKSIIAARAPEQSAPTDVGFYRVDPDFFPTMGMRLLAGRLLDERHARDRVLRTATGATAMAPEMMSRGANVVVNRRAAMQLGYREPRLAIGKTVKVGMDGEDFIPSTIVGVVEDTRIRTARDEIEPLIFGFDPTRASQVLFRYSNAVPSRVMDGLRRVWLRFQPDFPFEAEFAEDLIAQLYERERARAAMFLGFSLFAIVIACLGLFGLAAFTTERRTKEIGIRKVLGARIRDIVRLLTWQFSKPVVLANLIAWPLAWWAMRDWLNGFDVRIALTPGPFVLAGLLALAIAIGTVAGHAIRVARLNPIHALRYE
ncbi:MAG TPA: ABC transporter permease [Allosphingosinicella sp.]|jgi:putative ABC transport system permease protein